MRRNRTTIIVVAVVAALVLIVGVGLVIRQLTAGSDDENATEGSGKLTASPVLSHAFGGGYELYYEIANPEKGRISHWKLEFDLPSGQRVTDSSGGARTGNGGHVAVDGDRPVPSRGTTTVAVTVSGGTYKAPANCKVNDAGCGDGGAAPGKPGGVTAKAPSAGAAQVSWQGVGDAAGYLVYLDSGSDTRLVGATGKDETAFTATGLTPGTSYRFAVVARGAGGAVSAASDAASVRTPAAAEAAKGRIVLADLRQWNADKYSIKEVEASGQAAALTHLEWSFGKISDTGRCAEEVSDDLGAQANFLDAYPAARSVDGQADTAGQALGGGYNQLRKLKARYPNLKTTISLGGWSWSSQFPKVAASESERRAFVASCVDLYLRGNVPHVNGSARGGPGAAYGVFDGIDIDWEWPNFDGGDGHPYSAADKDNLTALMAEFRTQIDAYGKSMGRRFSLSLVYPGFVNKLDAGFDVPALSKYLDYATVSAFEFHGDERRTNHASNLYPVPDDPSEEKASGDGIVKALLDRGAPARQLVLTVTGWGKGWRDVGEDQDGLYQRGKAIEDDLTYRELAARGGRHYDAEHGAVWLYDKGEFWSYDDPEVIRQKAKYAADKGLGGLELWSLDGDDDHASLVKAMAS